MSIKKPMLAGTLKDTGSIEYPVLCTPKLDGIRCLIVDGKAVSRTFKSIPNNYIRNTVEQVAVDGFDGEIIVKGKSFNEITSYVMTEAGKPNFTFVVFDYCIDNNEGYEDRMMNLSKQSQIPNIEYLLPIQINNENELLKYESKCLQQGYEGVMLRTPDSPYKFGRSTLKQGWLLKLKRFTDSEATILDIYEQMTNENEEFIDELGHTKRSSHLSGKVPADTLGGFHVRDVKSGVEFKIGTGNGLDIELRNKIWNNRQNYIGKIVKYKSQKSGEKEKPRFPVFLGFRDQRDIEFKE